MILTLAVCIVGMAVATLGAEYIIVRIMEQPYPWLAIVNWFRRRR